MKASFVFSLLTLFVFKSFSIAKRDKVVNEIVRINSMREGLVSGVQGKVSSETFKAVCKPVGLELKKLGKKYGVEVKQVSMKYRNENHKPNEIEKEILLKMEKNKNLVEHWKTVEGGAYYLRRIDVKNACLNCHGSKASRPDFIKKKYSEDKAYGFSPGDLRGAYSVFFPEKN